MRRNQLFHQPTVSPVVVGWSMKQIAVRRRQLPRLELDQIAHRRRAEVVRPVAFGQHGAGEDAAVRLLLLNEHGRADRAQLRDVVDRADVDGQVGELRQLPQNRSDVLDDRRIQPRLVAPRRVGCGARTFNCEIGGRS